MSGTAVTPLQTALDNSEKDYVRQCVNKLVAWFDAVENSVAGKASVATGTTTSKVKTTNQTDFFVNGSVFRKAATDDFWTLTGAVLAISSWRKYLLCVDNTGAASVVQSTTDSTVSAAAVQLPALPANKCVFGVLTVATNGATTFTPGTTLLGAAGITATYVDGLDPLYLSSSTLANAFAAFLISSHK
jgi:hypothetical protein